MQLDLLKSTVEYILRKNFGTDVSVLILLHCFVEDETERFLNNEQFSGSMQWLEVLTLKTICENSFCPIVIFHSDEEEFSIYTPLMEIRGYVIFIDPKTEDFEDILKGNLEELEEKVFKSPLKILNCRLYRVKSIASDLFSDSLECSKILWCNEFSGVNNQ